MSTRELTHVIKAADRAIMLEDFDSLMDFYDEHATLVATPGSNASGKAEIRRAFVAIAQYFNHSLKIEQDKMKIIESEDTALVLAEAALDAFESDAFVDAMAIAACAERSGLGDPAGELWLPRGLDAGSRTRRCGATPGYCRGVRQEPAALCSRAWNRIWLVARKSGEKDLA